MAEVALAKYVRAAYYSYLINRLLENGTVVA